jgi:hypothetical protein
MILLIKLIDKDIDKAILVIHLEILLELQDLVILLEKILSILLILEYSQSLLKFATFHTSIF